jgi:type I restriction enzyme R subunit
LQRIKERKDASDAAAENRLRAYQDIAREAVQTKEGPERLNLTKPGEYGLFTVLRAYAATQEEAYLAECARRMVAHLQINKLLAPGWSSSKGGRMRVEQSLLAESWNPFYTKLGFDPNSTEPPFLKPAVEELSKVDA